MLSKIHKLIVKAGYKGARSNFYAHFGNKDSANPFEKTISVRILSRSLFTKGMRLIFNEIERSQVSVLCEKISWLIPLNKLCSTFSELLKTGTKIQLDRWLAKAEELNLKRLNRFVSGIKKDQNAVLNAIQYSSSSGVVEGNINRRMYGRASLELFKRKVILSTSG